MIVNVNVLGDLLELAAAVFALGEHLRNRVDVIGIFRVDRNVREVKWTLIDERIVAGHIPARAGVVGTPKNSTRRFDERKDPARTG